MLDCDLGKSQPIRLFDVFVLGPALIYVSQFRGPPLWARLFLAVAGLGVIVNNGTNYLRISKEQESTP